MRNSTASSLLAVALLAIAPVRAADDDVYYFDPKTCADGKGYIECSKSGNQIHTDCVLNFCDPKTYSGSISDCMDYVCKCGLAENILTCAQTHCWNQVSLETRGLIETVMRMAADFPPQVYSCEYQALVSDLAETCLEVDLEAIPFLPAPDDAPGSCSCNYENLMLAQAAMSGGFTACQEHLNDKGPDGIDEMTAHCRCCGSSAAMSV